MVNSPCVLEMRHSTAVAAHFRVIAMEQHNAGGQSRAPITAQDGWHTYAANHISHTLASTERIRYTAAHGRPASHVTRFSRASRRL